MGHIDSTSVRNHFAAVLRARMSITINPLLSSYPHHARLRLRNYKVRKCFNVPVIYHCLLVKPILGSSEYMLHLQVRNRSESPDEFSVLLRRTVFQLSLQVMKTVPVSIKLDSGIDLFQDLSADPASDDSLASSFRNACCSSRSTFPVSSAIFLSPTVTLVLGFRRCPLQA